MGQPDFEIAEGGLTAAGTESVNGVPCRKYLVDSVYVTTVTFTTPIKQTAKNTVQLQGEIWLADRAAWPAFAVRARLLETLTTEIAGGPSDTNVRYIEQDVTDVNSPDIVITAPE